MLLDYVGFFFQVEDVFFFFFQAEDGIRDRSPSRGLGDVYKRQQLSTTAATLFLHRNTVTYRLNKIKQITNTDFTLMPATYDFYLAAALWRLNENS